jgi:hypothetical protein
MPNSKAVGVAFSDPALDGAVVGASGGTVGFYGTTPVAKGAALTTQLTTITSTAPTTPDYAIQNLTSTSPFGFVSRDEGNTVLAVIKNLQDRVAELEARFQAYGLLP